MTYKLVIGISGRVTKYCSGIERVNDEYPKFKIGGIARILEHENHFPKDYVPNWSEEIFMIKKV